MNEILIMDKQNVINHDWSSSNLWIFWNVFNRNQGHDETEHRMEVERFILCIVAETVIGWQSKIVNWNIREGFKKTGIFPLGGGAFIFYIFSRFQKLISKHALNHAKMYFFLYLMTPHLQRIIQTNLYVPMLFCKTQDFQIVEEYQWP